MKSATNAPPRPSARACSLLLLLAALGTTTAPASAQPAAAMPDATQQAAEWFAKGKAFYGTGNVREAYEAYLHAWQLRQTYDIAGNLANAERLLGMTRDSAQHYAYWIRTSGSNGTKAQTDEVAKRFAEARAKLGALSIRVNVDGAEVFVDGKSAGQTPLLDDVFAKPGTRNIEVRLAGYEAATRTVQLVLGPAQELSIDLVAAGAVRASSAATPPADTAPTTPRAGTGIPILIVGGVVAGAGLIAATTFAVVSTGKGNAATSERTMLVQTGGPDACGGSAPPAGCQTLRSAIGAHDTFGNASVWTFVGAGTVAAATLVYGLVMRKAAPSPTAALRVTPTAGAGGGGVSIAGVW